MFGLSTINLALIGGLVLSVGVGATIAYKAISNAAVRKIELQQEKEVASAAEAQYERNVIALQRTAEEERQRADDLSQIKEAFHAIPQSRACLAMPNGREFMRIMRRQQRGGPRPAPAPASGALGVPGPAAASR